MPLDHFVPQVHLRNFNSAALGEKMYGIKKSDLEKFPCSSKDVCRILDGSTNSYLLQDRAIEAFLKTVEPGYNAAIAEIESGDVSRDSVYVVAGFAAYVACCSPGGMRIHQEPLQKTVEAGAEIMDRQGVLPKAPASLGGKSLTELLAEGSVKVKVDSKYPQALGISTITHRASVFGNSHWEILLNEGVSAFFTSDYPVAIEPSSDPRVLNRVVPLSPTIAIRIMPDINLALESEDLKFPKFSYSRRKLRHREVIEVNRKIVRCAEDLVFYSDDEEWITPFVDKNRAYRIEPITEKIPHGTGFLNWSTQRVVQTSPSTATVYGGPASG
jgi:hypothetical protein